MYEGDCPPAPLPPSRAVSEEAAALKAELAETKRAKLAAEQTLANVLKHDVTYMRDKTARLRDQIQEMMSHIERVSAESEQLLSAPKRSGDDPARIASERTRLASKHKVFRSQDSLLSDMLRLPEFQTIYHVFIAVLMVFGTSVVLEEYIEKRVFLELRMLFWSFGKFDVVVKIWVAMFACSFIPCQLLTLWVNRYLPTWVYLGLIGLLQSSYFIFPAMVVRHHQLPIASAIIVISEQVRLVMKMHSFVRESYKMAMADRFKSGKSDSDSARAPTSPSSDPQNVLVQQGSQEMKDANRTLLPSASARLQAYALFHFCPTLIYRNEYPRTAAVRWDFFMQRMLETLGCILYTYVIFNKFCVPQFERTALEPGDAVALLASVFTSTLPGIVVFVLGFFGILHAWCNAFAELCRFADRKFYTDWWNATSFSVYYRKWNIVVHDWLYAYLYLDVMQLGYSPTVGMFTVFFVSAIVHEYIITLAFGFFYPVLLVMFGGFGVFFVFLTKFRKGSRFWNVFMWFMLLIGNGILLVCYSREYYVRTSSDLSAYDQQSWVPLSWQPFILPHVGASLKPVAAATH